MDERSRYLSKEEYLIELKKAPPENLGRMLDHWDRMRIYSTVVSSGFGVLALACAGANQLSENEIVDNLTLAGGLITTALSMLSTTGIVKTHYNGKVVSEIQSR